MAAACETSEGVVYVPAQMGLGTPHWDYGARGTLLGLTRGSNRCHITRAVLEGIAQRGADLVEAAEADAGINIATLRVDGGMTDNAVFVQALADISGRTVEVEPGPRCHRRGSGPARGARDRHVERLGRHRGDVASRRSVVEPRPDFDRDAASVQWARAIDRAEGVVRPSCSALDF